MKSILILFILAASCLAQMVVKNTDEVELLVVTEAGNMGIGVTAPAEKLAVNGAIQSKSGAPAALNANHAGYAFDVETDGGLFNPAADMLTLASNGIARIYLDAGGRVGIGTSTPSSMLVIGEDLGDMGEADGPVIGSAQNSPSIASGKDAGHYSIIQWNNTEKSLVFSSKNGGTNYANTIVVKDGRIGINAAPPADKQLYVANGPVRVDELAGNGTRMVVVHPSGVLEPGPAATNTGVRALAQVNNPTQSFPLSARTVITEWTHSYDPDGLYTPAENRWTIQQAGWYRINAYTVFYTTNTWEMVLTMDIAWGTPYPSGALPEKETKLYRTYYNKSLYFRPRASALAWLTPGDQIEIGITPAVEYSSGQATYSFISARFEMEYLGE